MPIAGWYPDPAGRPGAFRYWDGEAWTADLADHPYAAPPGGRPPAPPPAPSPVPAPVNPFDNPTSPPAFQSYETQATGPAWSPQPQQFAQFQPQPQPAHEGSPARTIGLLVLAAVLTILLGVATFLVVRSLTDEDDDGSAGPAPSPASSEAAAQLEDPGDPFADDATPTEEQCTGGAAALGATAVTAERHSGGGLSMPAVPGFIPDAPYDQAAAFAFADGVAAPSRPVVDGWVAVYALGGLDRARGFTSPGQAAADVLECMTLSPAFYASLAATELVDSQQTTVDGHPAWVMDAEIRVDDQVDVEGDAAKVIVVDTGDPDFYGLFVSAVPIGDQELLAQQQSQVDELTVD